MKLAFCHGFVACVVLLLAWSVGDWIREQQVQGTMACIFTLAIAVAGYLLGFSLNVVTGRK